MFAGLIMVVINFLMCMAYLLLNLAEPAAPCRRPVARQRGATMPLS